MKKQERVIPKKNYLYLAIMLIAVVVLTILVFDINQKIQLKKLETSYLHEYVSEVNLSDLNNILTEPSSELFIFITKTNDEKVYNLETNIKKVIKLYDLRDNFIYIDYTDNENSLSELNKILGSDIKTIPAIVYYKNGEFIKSIDSSLDMLSSDDIEQILDEYEVN